MGLNGPLIYLDSCAIIYYGCAEFWTNDERLNKIAPNLSRNVCAP